MKLRDIKKFCKECGTCYNSNYVEQLATQTAVREGFIGAKSIKFFLGGATPTERQINAIKEKRLPAFKIRRNFYSYDFELMEKNDNDSEYHVVTAEVQNTATSNITASIPDGRVSLTNFYSSEELEVANKARNRLREYGHGGSNEVYGYHSGQYLYTRDRGHNLVYGIERGKSWFESMLPRGAFSTGADDTSCTMSCELEVAFDRGTKLSTADAKYLLNNFNPLGHFEHDGSVNGVEFDFHPYTYDKLMQVKPVVTSFLNELNQKSFRSDHSTGLHIHIGRDAFKDEYALMKFYFIINTQTARQLWETVSSRMTNFNTNSRSSDINRSTAFSYCGFLNAVDDVRRNGQNLQRFMNDHEGSHSVACNLQHPQTVEVRIFRTTLSAEYLYSYFKLMKNLVDLVNKEDLSEIRVGDIIEGTTFASGWFDTYETESVIDISWLNASLSPEELYAQLGEAIQNQNGPEIIRLTGLIAEAQRNGGNN